MHQYIFSNYFLQLFITIIHLQSLNGQDLPNKEDIIIKFSFDEDNMTYDYNEDYPAKEKAPQFPFDVNLRAIDIHPSEAGQFSEVYRQQEVPGNGQKKCIEKVILNQVTEYDEIIKCDHTYNKRCHTTLITTYDPQQVEECEENYIKTCLIEFEPVAYKETVQICKRPLVKDCDHTGPNICRTVYQAECWTKQETKKVEEDLAVCSTIIDQKCEETVTGYTSRESCREWPRQECKVSKATTTKTNPVTGCTKEPVEFCSPLGCGFKEGSEECYSKPVTVVEDKPVESCDLQPKLKCGFVTKLVPKLEPSEECVDVPKEVCVRSRGNERKVTKPSIKKWCYVPSAESGFD